MLPRHRRVSTVLFKEIMKDGKSYHTPHLSLRWKHMTAPNQSRFSVVVPKKTEKRAVGRNYTKRVVYTLLNPYLHKGIMGIFFVKKSFSKEEIPMIENQVKELLKRLGN
jgi:ribonuclease P protein component